MTVYDNALMLQGDWTWMGVGYIILKALIAIFLWGAASIGFLFVGLSLAERIWATSSAFLLVVALPVTDEAGFALSAAFVLWHWLKARRGKALA